MPADTKTRILAAATELYRRQGMTGTGLKQIAELAKAPFGSIYHFFPGGKAELTEAVVRSAGASYGDLVLGVFAACPDFPTGVKVGFELAANNLEATGWIDACPIETIALEVANTDENLRIATADVFTDWVDRGVAATASSGLPESVRRELILGFVAALEGAFVLARAMRSKEPLLAAGETVLVAVEKALHDHA